MQPSASLDWPSEHCCSSRSMPKQMGHCLVYDTSELSNSRGGFILCASIALCVLHMQHAHAQCTCTICTLQMLPPSCRAPLRHARPAVAKPSLRCCSISPACTPHRQQRPSTCTHLGRPLLQHKTCYVMMNACLALVQVQCGCRWLTRRRAWNHGRTMASRSRQHARRQHHGTQSRPRQKLSEAASFGVPGR
jgi:hypothetical protein